MHPICSLPKAFACDFLLVWSCWTDLVRFMTAVNSTEFVVNDHNFVLKLISDTSSNRRNFLANQKLPFNYSFKFLLKLIHFLIFQNITITEYRFDGCNTENEEISRFLVNYNGKNIFFKYPVLDVSNVTSLSISSMNNGSMMWNFLKLFPALLHLTLDHELIRCINSAAMDANDPIPHIINLQTLTFIANNELFWYFGSECSVFQKLVAWCPNAKQCQLQYRTIESVAHCEDILLEMKEMLCRQNPLYLITFSTIPTETSPYAVFHLFPPTPETAQDAMDSVPPGPAEESRFSGPDGPSAARQVLKRQFSGLTPDSDLLELKMKARDYAVHNDAVLMEEINSAAAADGDRESKNKLKRPRLEHGLYYVPKRRKG